MPARDGSHALDHIVVVLFENRSLDNVLGHLYGPADGKNFDGVIGKDLTNPIPDWAEHRDGRGVVPYTVATDMDSWVCPRSVETSPLRRYGDGRDAAEVRRGLQAWCGGAGLRDGEADRAGGPGSGHS